jgi:hypothetical protein
VAEQIKVLDLRKWTENGRGPSRGGISQDQLRFGSLPPGFPELICHYATVGERASGTCLSHPRGSKWLEVKDLPNSLKRSAKVKRCFALHARLDASPSSMDLLNEVVFDDGFEDASKGWFHSHVAWPTESLSLVILFSKHKPCQEIRALRQRHAGDAFMPAAAQPFSSFGGEMVYWRKASPVIGELYQLEWEW